jgi:integrase
MANKRAKVLDEQQFATLLTYVENHSTMPERDRLILLLSFRAGLRAAEIAKLDISTSMADAEGRIARVIRIFSNVAKKNREREIPMHPDIKQALKVFRTRFPMVDFVAVSARDRKRRLTPNAVTVYMWELFRRAGFKDCSSHSGRRTFGTQLARRANQFNNSLRDVQRLMGHARLDTTESYIEVSEETRDLVTSLGS